MPKTKEQFNQMRDETKAQIIKGALEVFAKKGYAATKISDISKVSKMSAGLIYHYFESKEALFIYLVEESTNISSGALIDLDRFPGTAKEKIIMLSQMMAEQIKSNREAVNRFMMMIQVGLVEDELSVFSRVEDKIHIPLQILGNLIEEGQKEGYARVGKPLAIAQLYWAAVQGLCMQKLVMEELFEDIDGELLQKIILE